MTFDPKLTDIHILALTLYGETIGIKHRTPAALEELVALGCKIRNRVLNGSSYRVECVQCDCWYPERNEGSHLRVMAAMEHLLTGTVTDPRYLEAAWVALGMIHGYCRDVLKGATESHPVSELPRPEWAQHRIPAFSYAKQSWYLPDEVRA